MDEKEAKGVFELIDGLKPVDPQKLKDFEKTMTEEVIPEIVDIIEKRKLKAAESRNWQLKV
jgi:hypothetical protein